MDGRSGRTPMDERSTKFIEHSEIVAFSGFLNYMQ